MSELATLDTLTRLEKRVQRKKKLLDSHQKPVLSLTLNIPTSLNQRVWASQLFNSALNALFGTVRALDAPIIEQQISTNHQHEALFSIDIRSSTLLKKAMIQIEHNHPQGALFNFDVMCRQGKTISRRSSYMLPRPCLICDDTAQRCSTMKRHTPAQIEEAILSLVES
ncbi:citrate lyase holo-[acyl-carrier protein] synthase [Vibrio atypicus]|uniref:citrate lyase holo-[acyl-carrier protein] synthase n=1 Tax=Vibrio atypicus TaxID=558271 RepID=UPI00373514B9